MLAFAPTLLAVSRKSSFCGNLAARVFRRVFMPSLAMGSCLLPSCVRLSPFPQSRQIKKSGFGQHLFNRPIRVIPLQKRVDMKPNLFRPLHRSQSNAVVRNFDVCLSVVGLLFTRCPATIFGAIRAIVVNAIQCCAKWAIPHIGNKIFKRIPSFANVNTSCAISAIRRVFGINAPLLGSLPNGVQLGARFTMTTFHAVNVLQWSEKVK